LQARISYDRQNRKFKIYLKKENPPNNAASILGFLMSEMPEIESWYNEKAAELLELLENGDSKYKPDNEALLHQPNKMEFWEHPDVWQTDSGLVRARVAWSPISNKYTFHLNIFKLPGEKFPEHFGPKIQLTSAEFVKFLEIYHDFKSKLPDDAI
jgi:hypothetical protein